MSSGNACRRAGCAGVLEEGYCDACGLAAVTERPAGEDPVRPVPAGTGSATDRWSRSARGARRGERHPRSGGQRPLGAGLLALPDLPSIAPEEALLVDATVPENKRFCGACDARVRREAGFCGRCGAAYSFGATLRSGDLVANQYEVRGPIAFGGLGWIYLAFDRLLSRYVVLKGLLNTRDAAAAAAAVAERQFLAAVKHPNIVAIYNFVQVGNEGFIVMEYVGGKTLREVRKQRGPLPPTEAVAYVHRALGAMAALHRAGLLFCDFKPDNVMLEHDDIKLIDLGGVRRMDDPAGDVFGTAGFSAPEAGKQPGIASDLFTVGRTLAALLMEIPGFAGEHRMRLPAAEAAPVLAAHPFLHRFLLKATATEADDRFGSADEMAEQLLGVLRELVAAEAGRPCAGTSREFGPDLLAFDAGNEMDPVLPDPRYLPMPVLDTLDTAAQAVASALSLPDLGRRLAALRLAVQGKPSSREARIRLAGVLTDAGEVAEADALLESLAAEDPWDWRVLWFQARVALRRYRPDVALERFDQVCFDLPGELAPKLALGFAAEVMGDTAQACHMYDLVSRVDPSHVSAIFGLARCLAGQGRRQEAVEAYGRMAPSSALFLRGRVQALRTLLEPQAGMPEMEDLLGAAEIAESVQVAPDDRCELHREILETALRRVCAGAVGPQFKDRRLLGRELTERSLRGGLEATLREMARAAYGDRRIALIDAANRVRPRTLF